MADKKKVLMFGILFMFAIVLSLSMASAAVRVISPNNFTNWSSDMVMFNVTFLNGSDVLIDGDIDMNAINASFFYNLSGTWTLIGNSSECTTDGAGGLSTNVTYCWGEINVSSLVDGYYSINVTVRNKSVESNMSAGSGNLTHGIIFDNTAPAVEASNFSLLVNNQNFSGNLLLNISVIDNTSVINDVMFNITNSTGGQNGTFTASRAAGANGYIFTYTLDTTDFVDDTYNITAFVNDTAGNLNSTAFILTLIFDNTAPIVEEANITRVLTGNNYSVEDFMINVTIRDLTSTIQNVTLNITNSSGGQNGTYVMARQGTGDVFGVFISTLDYIDGVYNLTILSNDTAGNRNDTAYVWGVIFDNTVPVIEAANFTSVTTGARDRGNHSGRNLVINVSVYDLTADIGAVLFNITNSSSNAQNATYTATRVGTTDVFRTWINTTDFVDGTYNITVYVNDTAGNDNNTAYIGQIIFDNTAPSISQTCTPDPVNEGAVITCSCSASDILSTVKGSASFTVNPSTSLTGSISTACSVSDHSGNSASASLSYNVEGGGGSSGGGGGGGGGSSSGGDTTTTEEEVTTASEPTGQISATYETIAPLSPVTVANFDSTYAIDNILIDVIKEASNVKITVKKYDDLIPENIPVEKSGVVYRYLEIEAENLGDDNLEKATIKLQVGKVWVTDTGIAKEDVALFRLDSGVWNELPTTYLNSDVDFHYYEATTTSFSFFAISEKVKEVVPEKSNLIWWIIGIIVLLVIVVAVVMGRGGGSNGGSGVNARMSDADKKKKRK